MYTSTTYLTFIYKAEKAAKQEDKAFKQQGKQEKRDRKAEKPIKDKSVIKAPKVKKNKNSEDSEVAAEVTIAPTTAEEPPTASFYYV